MTNHMTNYNIKFDRISKQQYVIVFNQTRRARRSSKAAYIVPPPTQKTYHVNAFGQTRVFNFLAECLKNWIN